MFFYRMSRLNSTKKNNFNCFQLLLGIVLAKPHDHSFRLSANHKAGGQQAHLRKIGHDYPQVIYDFCGNFLCVTNA